MTLFLHKYLAAGVFFAGTALALLAQQAPLITGAVSSPWTLESALREALRNSPDAKIAQARLHAAQAAVEMADAAAYPTLSLGAGYMQTNNPMQSFGNILNQSAYSPAIDFNDPGQTDNFNTGLYLKYDLYAGGRTAAVRAQARDMDMASQYDRDAVYSALSEAVAGAYFEIVQAYQMALAIEKTMESLRESLRVARELEAAGKLLKSELLNIEVQYLGAQEMKLSVNHQLALAQRRFAALLGLDGMDDVVIAQDDPALRALTAPVQAAAAVRPEYIAMEKKRDAAIHARDAQSSAHLPTVSLVGGYEYNRGWRLGGWGDSWTAALVVQVPLFDGFATRSRVRQASAKISEYDQQLRKLELDLKVELDRARLNYELACRQYDLSGSQLAQAGESARLIRERFATGSMMATELLNAEARLLDARVKNDLARNRQWLTALQWRRALGLSLLPNL